MNPALVPCWRVVVDVDQAELARAEPGVRVTTIALDTFRIDLDHARLVEPGTRVERAMTRYEMFNFWRAYAAYPWRSALQIQLEHADDDGAPWVRVGAGDVERLLAEDAARADRWEVRERNAKARRAALERQAWATARLAAAEAEVVAARAEKAAADEALA